MCDGHVLLQPLMQQKAPRVEPALGWVVAYELILNCSLRGFTQDSRHSPIWRLHRAPVCRNRTSGHGGGGAGPLTEAGVALSDAMKQAMAISTSLHTPHTRTIHPQDSDGPQALPFEQAQGNPG